MQSKIRDELARELKIPSAELDGSLCFTALGGHSLSALHLVSIFKRIGVSLTVGELLQNTPINDVLSRALPVYRQANDQSDNQPTSGSTDLSHSDIDMAISTTPSPSLSTPSVRCLAPDTVATIESLRERSIQIPEMQLTLIQGTYAKPGNNIIAYHCMCPLEELHATQAAWQQVIEAEEIFRKDLRIEDGNGHLVDTENTPYRWRRAEVADRDALDDELRKPPSFRDVGFEFRIITMAGDDPIACILWHVHHAFIDGFSMQIILDKVSRVLAGQPIYPGPSFVTVASERNALIEERKAEAIEYWDSQKEVLDMAGGEMRLPRSAGADLSKNFWNHMATFTLNISQSQLGDYAHRHHVTVASIYYAAWALVLSIICDSDVVRMGVVMSGRSLPVSDILDVVGSLVNTLPLGIVVRKDVNTVAFICKVFQQLLELSTFDWSIPEHGYRRQFSSVLAMQFDVAGRTTHPSSMTSPSSRMNSDIPLSITVEADGTIHVQFSHEYDSEHINLLGTYFTRTIECLMRPAHTISMCLENILSLADRQTLLSYGNCLSGLTTESSVHDNLVVLMKHAAAKHPESCAANQGAQKMSYRELDQWSDSVATHLGVYVRQGDVVCVHANPSIYWLVAIYGILKAGAVYCPLNTNLNPGLRNSMFKSSGAAVYLTPLCSEIRYRPKGNRYAWAVEDLLQRQNEQEPDEFPHVMFPEANAYLCFTSGSTGKPKGVLCTHQGLVAFQKDLEVRLHAQPGRKIAQIMSVSFDGSIHEVFSALSYGATLALPDTNDPFAHLHEVDTCIFTPSLAARLDPTDYPNLSNVYLVGEQVPQDVNDRWAARVSLYNMYGPTEATCGATIKRLLPGHKVTIGRPNPTTRIYILNRNRHLAPQGVMGQIYLAGVQVSNGYINEPDLTKKRFFPDSICRGLGERMYATGDIGYWNEDGELVCLGRNDRQTKLRGFRLDLDDLEARIAGLPDVAAVAIARYEDDLVALVQPATVCVAECRKHISTVLPVHAIPRYIIPVSQFPMTPVGKLDYKAIVQNVDVRRMSRPSNEMNTTERKTTSIWADILAVKEIEITPETGFLAMGGHSLLQLRLASRLSKAFNISVPLTTIIEAATLRDLSVEIDKLRERECRGAVQVSSELDEGAVSRMEAEWISKYACSESTTSFNVSFACQLSATVDVDRLREAWNAVIAAHDILRSRYTVCGGQPRRVYSDRAPVVRTVDNYDILKEINRPFNIFEDDIIRVIMSPNMLLITVSHIICDLTTMQVLLNEAQRVYQGATPRSGTPSYMAADAWYRVAPDGDLAFWTTYLRGAPRPTRKRASYAGTSRVSILPQETAFAMNAFIKASPFSHHQVALAAVSLALHPQQGHIDTLLGGPFLNRWSENDMNTIGLFLEPLPFRIQFDLTTVPDADAYAFLRSIQCSSQAAISHAVPWQELLCHLNITPGFPNHPLFETMVTFHNRANGLTFDVDGAAPLYTWSEGSKFGLMCEFTELSDGEILLRLEYDESLYPHTAICMIERKIVLTMELLTRNAFYTEMMRRLREVEMETSNPQSKDPADMFLSPVRRP